MKKLLACLLVMLLLGITAVVGVSATPPVVTHITSEWNGVILLGWWQPIFTPENLTVTVHYSYGAPRVLDDFSQVLNVDLLDYEVMRVSYRGTSIWPYQWHDTTFAFPANFLQLYIENLALLPINPPVINLQHQREAFAFVPQANGWHTIHRRNSDVIVRVLDENFQEVYQRAVRNVPQSVQLQQGRTYYVLVTRGRDTTVEIRHMNAFQNAWHFVSSFLLRLVDFAFGAFVWVFIWVPLNIFGFIFRIF